MARNPIREAFLPSVRFLARFRPVVRLALGVREFTRSIIKHHCMDGIHKEVNGEMALMRCLTPQTRVFVDVGANVGDWTALCKEMIPKGGRGILFDPSEQAMQRLKTRFAEESNLHLIQAAVGDSEGELPFFEEPNAGETSSLLGGSHPTATVQRMVRVTTLDAEAERLGVETIDFLKIDAEGYDFHVLLGARRLLQSQRIGALQFEYNQPWTQAGSTLAGAYAYLEGMGYRVFLLKADGLYDFPYRRYGEWFSYANFVAVAPSHLRFVEPLLRGSFD